MTGFWRSKRGLFLSIMMVVAAAAAVAMRIEGRSTVQHERETKARIEKDAKQSIDKATDGLKLCPLSDPDCSKR